MTRIAADLFAGERAPQPTQTTPGSIELIHLGAEAQYLGANVLGRHTPGVLPLHDILRG